MNNPIEHSQPPVIPPEIFLTVMGAAEQHPDAKLIAIYDPESYATICGFASNGAIKFWSVRMPTTEDMARELLVGELQRGKLTEDEIVFLNMREISPLEADKGPTIN